MVKFVSPFLPLFVTAVVTIIFATLASFGFVKWLIFQCPEAVAYLGVNSLTKGGFVVTDGLNFKYPWDHVDLSNKYDLNTAPKNFKLSAKTSDGNEIELVEVNTTTLPDLSSATQLKKYNALGEPQTKAEDALKGHLNAKLGGIVTSVASRYSLPDFLKKLAEISGAMYQGVRVEIASGSSFALRYGINTVDVTIGSIKLKDTPTLRLVSKLVAYETQAQQMTQNGSVTYAEAFNLLLSADPDSNALKVMGRSYGFINDPSQGGGQGGNP